jgi:uncharacterized membrane protein
LSDATESPEATEVEGRVPAPADDSRALSGSIVPDKASDPAGHGSISVTSQLFAGPLPHPSILKQYNEIQPDFAERILRLTEGEAEHRRFLTLRAQRIDGIETVLGQIFALVVALAAFATAAWLGYLGHPAAASIVGGSTVAALVVAFIQGRRYLKSSNNLEADEDED